MTMLRLISLVGLSLGFTLLWALTLEAQESQTEPKTNFVFLLVDDLGWADLGCFGSTFHKTPHIDALCNSGMKFTHGYAACPVCSPTRASILTGRHPVRVEITDWIPGRRTDKDSKFQHIEDRDNLALRETTIAEKLQENGYQTFFAGKWHLGDAGHWPTDQGFDFNIGGNVKGSPPGGYYAPWKNPTLNAKKPKEYVTERLTEESIRFLKERDPEKPFLLYLSYYNVHTPITPYKKRFKQFKKTASEAFDNATPFQREGNGTSRMRQDNPAYASMVSAVDDSVGSVLNAIEQLALDKNTVVMFFSDNGGLCTTRKTGPTSNLPLRSGKGWLYEGGVREPMIIRAPGVTKPMTVCESSVVSMDFFPTILELAGLPKKPELHADGKSLVPMLQGRVQAEDRTLYWHYPHYHGSTWTPGASILEGDWKLIEFYERDDCELYNLANDQGESDDLSKQRPELTKKLRNKLAAWQKRMGSQMPKMNPDYQREIE